MSFIARWILIVLFPAITENAQIWSSWSDIGQSSYGSFLFWHLGQVSVLTRVLKFSLSCRRECGPWWFRISSSWWFGMSSSWWFGMSSIFNKLFCVIQFISTVVWYWKAFDELFCEQVWLRRALVINSMHSHTMKLVDFPYNFLKRFWLYNTTVV